jgi:hypothetical protein
MNKIIIIALIVSLLGCQVACAHGLGDFTFAEKLYIYPLMFLANVFYFWPCKIIENIKHKDKPKIPIDVKVIDNTTANGGGIYTNR